MTTPQTADQILRDGLRALRVRSRELAINNDYAKAFYRRLKVNVVGAHGIRLQMAARTSRGDPDKDANEKIEGAWRAWGKRGVCTVCGTLGWRDLENLAIESVAKDGEVLIRKVRGFDNPFGFALQLIEADHLDDDFNEDFRDGRRVIMGVEINRWGRPLAYHLLRHHPGDRPLFTTRERHERIPADQILHLFARERVTQRRGYPWAHTAMTTLKIAGGYEEAALVAARAGAAKMGFFTEVEADAYAGDDPREEGQAAAETDAEGNLIQDAEAGHFERLPPGVDFKEFDPGYPTGEFGPFMKAILHKAAVGMGSTYSGLTGDLADVNFSSIRAGTIEERDLWRDLQSWIMANLHAPIFDEWLALAMLAGQVALPMSKLEQFNAPTWRPRGWTWVDPFKDQQANELAVKNGFKTRSMVAAEQGADFEDIIRTLAKEQQLAADEGVTLGRELGPPAAPSVNDN